LVELSYPGVYMVEVPPIARAITAASTSTAAFIGMAERGPVNEAVLVTSFSDFLDTFGSFTTKDVLGIDDKSVPPNNDIYLPYAVWSFFQNGGNKCYIIRLAPGSKPATVAVPTDSDATKNAFTINALSPGGEGNKLVVAVKKGTIDIPDPLPGDPTHRTPTYKIEVRNDPSAPPVESFDGLTMSKGEDNSIDTVVNDNSKFIRIDGVDPKTKPKLKPDVSPTMSGGGASPTTGESSGMGGGGTGAGTVVSLAAALDVGYDLAGASAGNDVLPGDIVDQLTVGKSALDKITDVSIIAAPGYTDKDYQVINAGFAYAEAHRNGLGDAFFIADVPADKKSQRDVMAFIQDTHFQPSNNGYGALYFPWVYARDQIARGRNAKILLPPSAFVAGIYAKIDNSRGVWKAPAGTEAGISGHQGLLVNLTDMDQGVINLSGVNALRTFVGYGSVVWGARTVSHDVAWRYIPVRRMANFLKSSIYDGIQWAVFEPNDEPLWAALRLNIGGFMMDLFSQHAFQGATPDQAFFVKCDNETTTETDQQLGIVNVLVGFAPLKPAEFVVVKLSQKVSEQKT
jgi:Bacteriophage tail sheath protein